MPQERKILAVLYVLQRKQGKKPRFLVVEDADSKEWTFISGTCEVGEKYSMCAMREIYEETKGLIALPSLPKRTRHFQTKYGTKHVRVLFIPLQLSEQEMKKVVEDFTTTDTQGREEMEENTNIRFETLRQFMRRKRVWDFVKNLCSTDTFISMCPK